MTTTGTTGRKGAGLRAGITMAVALGAVAAAGGTAFAAQAVLRGTWAADLDRGGAPRVELRAEDGRQVSTLPRRDARDLVEGLEAAGGRYTMEREAGTLAFDGTVSGRRGRGVFTFRPADAFREAMDALGYGRPSDRELLAAAVHDLTRARVTSLRDGGVPAADFDELVAAAVFDVDGDFLAEMRAVGFHPDLDELIAFRVHGVTADYVRAMGDAGLALDEDGAVAFRVHGLTATWLDSLRASGLPVRDADHAVAYRIHGVTPAFAADVAALGLGTPSGDDLVALRIHGVDRAFVEAMADAGVAPRDLDEAVAFRIHGVTPELVNELRERGIEDLDGEELLKIRIHGLDRILLGRRGG